MHECCFAYALIALRLAVLGQQAQRKNQPPQGPIGVPWGRTLLAYANPKEA